MSQAPDIPRIEDCWNRIGVWGRQRPRCDKLEGVTHCYNCEVYRAAGQAMHARPVPADYRAEWTQIVATRKQIAVRFDAAALVFRIGREWLAIPAAIAAEIVERRAIHSVPHRSSGVLLGLVNIRGKLQLCMSIGALLGISGGDEEQTKKERRSIYPRMVVAEEQQQRFVFPVDEVLGTYRYAARDIRSLPATLTGAITKYSVGALELEGRHIGLLDHALLMYAFSRSLM